MNNTKCSEFSQNWISYFKQNKTLKKGNIFYLFLGYVGYGTTSSESVCEVILTFFPYNIW